MVTGSDTGSGAGSGGSRAGELLTVLRAEHRTISQALADLRHRPDDRRARASLLQTALRHLDAEEAAIYPRLVAGIADRSRAEHDALRALLGDLEAADIALETFMHALERLRAGFDRHVDEEEQTVLPLIAAYDDDAATALLRRYREVVGIGP